MTALTIAALVIAILAASWAGLFALAEESPGLASTIGQPPPDERGQVPLNRAFQVSRLALIILAGVAAAEAVGWWNRPPWPGLGVVLVAGALLFMLADALPRTIGMLVPEAAAAAAAVARGTLLPFRPLLALIGGAERLVERGFPRPATSDAAALLPSQRDVLLGVFSLGDTTVAEAMIPRIDVAALESSASWEDMLELFRRTGHTRVPVFDGTLDNIVGVLHSRDVVPAAAGAAAVPDRWQDLVHPGEFVPESKTLAAQLRDFLRSSSHLAVVVDEFGGTAGVITLSDIRYEIAGDLREGGSEEAPSVEQQGEDRFWVDGGVSLDQLSARLHTPLERDGVSTVGGLVYSELGRVPAPGEELRVGEFRVVVERVVRRRVQRVYFERLQPQPEASVPAARAE